VRRGLDPSRPLGAQLRDLLEGLALTEALVLRRMLGRAVGTDAADVVTDARLRAMPTQADVSVSREGRPIISRSKRFLGHAAGQPAVLGLDRDARGMPAPVRERLERGGGLLAVLERVRLALAQAAVVIRPSVSTGLRDTASGQATPDGGLHVFVPIQDGGGAAAFMDRLHKRLVLAGFSFAFVRQERAVQIRSAVDTAASGRGGWIWYEAPSQPGPGLEHVPGARASTVREGGALDTCVALPPLTEAEERQLVLAEATLRDDAGLDVVEVAEVLRRPADFHGKTCADLLAAVSSADLHDSHGGIARLRTSRRPRPFVASCYADRVYAGPRVAGATQVRVELVGPKPGQRGFAVQPRRWVIERTFPGPGGAATSPTTSRPRRVRPSPSSSSPPLSSSGDRRSRHEAGSEAVQPLSQAARPRGDERIGHATILPRRARRARMRSGAPIERGCAAASGGGTALPRISGQAGRVRDPLFRCVQPIRRPCSSTTFSPSSLAKAPRCGPGRMSSTVSEGRQSRTPRGVTTIGRLMRIGCAIMASRSWSSVSDGSSRPSSS
jgi:hypothetical protein